MCAHPMPAVWFQIRCCAASLLTNLCLLTPELGVQGKRQLLGQQRPDLLGESVLGSSEILL